MILTPTVSVMGAYYGVGASAAKDKAEITQRISSLELESAKTFADKGAVQQIARDVQDVKVDVAEIKALLKDRRR